MSPAITFPIPYCFCCFFCDFARERVTEPMSVDLAMVVAFQISDKIDRTFVVWIVVFDIFPIIDNLPRGRAKMFHTVTHFFANQNSAIETSVAILCRFVLWIEGKLIVVIAYDGIVLSLSLNCINEILWSILLIVGDFTFRRNVRFVTRI